MRKIYEIYQGAATWLASFGSDKWLHLLAGALVAFLAATLDTACFCREVWQGCIVGFLVVLFGGVFKEVVDFFLGKGFDFKDMVFTWAGGIVGALLFLI